MKILVTGGKGQLGTDAVEVLGESHEVLAHGAVGARHYRLGGR